MNYTIKDIAREAGVSIATVSRAINNKGRIDEGTKKRILEIIDRVGFQPDHTARTMVMKKSKSIGLVIPTLTNEYWAALTEQIQKQLVQKEYALVLYTVGEDETSLEKEISALRALVERKVDGIIYHGITRPNRSENPHVMELVRSGLQFVSFEQKIPGISSVSGDHLHGAMTAVSHLISLGHHKIAFIGSALDIQEREIGFRSAMLMNGLLVNENLVKHIVPTFESGFSATEDLLESKEKFSAVFCWNDMIAFGVIRSLEAQGIKVPDDIAVVGYDDIITAGLFKPTLTTVRQPIHQIGKAIVDLMMEEILPVEEKTVARTVIVEMELVIRQSCGANRSGQIKSTCPQ